MTGSTAEGLHHPIRGKGSKGAWGIRVPTPQLESF